MTDKYKALRDALAGMHGVVVDEMIDFQKDALFIRDVNGLCYCMVMKSRPSGLAIAKIIIESRPSVIAELLAERDQFAEEKAWIDHQPDDQERLYELIRADAVRSYQRHKSRIGGQQTVRGDSFEDHVMFSALHHAREQMANIAEERDRMKAAIEQVIEENLHLADGEVCTLIKLKQAIGMK